MLLGTLILAVLQMMDITGPTRLLAAVFTSKPDNED